MDPDLIGHPFAPAYKELTITREVIKRLFHDGKEALPYEFSALLAGQDAAITHCFANPGSQIAPHTFVWEGRPFIQALRLIQDAGLQWLGVVHTHPLTPPVPSARDLAGWHYPQLSYWIISLARQDCPRLQLFQLQGGRFVPRPYTIC